MTQDSLKPIFFLMGPTASGKTALAIELVQHFPLEIISVDSAMIYKDMDIGTAKPTQEELAIAPHHLIDIRNPTEFYSAGDFVQDTNALITEIHARGKFPLLVGGTMLYFKALQNGIAALPEQDPALRAEIEEQAKAIGWPALHAKLTEIDPPAAAKIKPTDSQRIGRALEVFYLTNTPLSILQQQTNPTKLNIKAFAIFPPDRTVLHQRIALRIIQMMQQGFIEEVIHLREKYALNANLPSMRAVGYRQIWDFLEGKMSHEDLQNQILFATRQYAKRQLTWLKPWENVCRFDLNETETMKNALQEILS